MGMIIEFNWFMVVANENKILEDKNSFLISFLCKSNTILSKRVPNAINR